MALRDAGPGPTPGQDAERGRCLTAEMVRERVDPDIGDPEAPRRPWVRWTAVLVACALAGVVTGLVIAGARNSPPVAAALQLEQEVTDGRVVFPGVDAGNPFLLDTSGCAGSPECTFVLAKTSLGRADLRGVVVSGDLSRCSGPDCAAARDTALADVTRHLDMLRAYGFRDVPAATPGAQTPLARPDSGLVDDTAASATPGSDLVVAEARRASPQRPLLVSTTWPPTTVATAYLSDPAIAERVVVALHGTPEPTTSWATEIVTGHFRTVVAQLPPSPPAPGAAAVARTEAEIPPGPLRDTLLARPQLAAAGDLVGDAAFAMLLHRPATWRAVGEAGGGVALTSFDLAAAEQEWFATLADPGLHGGRTVAVAAPPPPPPPPPPRFAVRVDFAPPGTEVPDGYILDDGTVFAEREGGLRYGWDADVSADMRRRGLVEDTRYDTFAHFSKAGDRTWEVEAPEGAYDVRLALGDPQHTDQVNALDVEGTIVTDGEQDHFDAPSVTVEVTDGRLTIRPAPGAANAKISFLQLTQR